MKTKTDKLLNKFGKSLNVAKNEVLDKKNKLKNEIEKSTITIKKSTVSFSESIENSTKKLSSNLSNSIDLEQVILKFLKSVNIDKMISAIKDLEVVDKKTLPNLELIVNVLTVLRDNKDGKGIELAISLFKGVNISDVIKTLQPLINLIPYGNQLMFVLNLILKISKIKK